MAVDHQKIITDLSKKIFSPIYLLCGEEPFYIDLISDYIEDNVLSEADKEFNQYIFYGRDTEAEKVLEAAKRYPMMAPYQVIIIKEAQDMRSLEDLTVYAENPIPTTILVICYKYKKYDKRKSLAKVVEKKGVYYESSKIYDDKLPAWITSFVATKGYKITPKAAVLLGDFLGTDLSKIANEVNKLLIFKPQDNTITEDLIAANIGISKDYNVFELQEALGSKNVEKAFKIVNYFNSNPKENPLAKVVPMIFSFFSKVVICSRLTDKSQGSVASALSISPFFAKDYVKASGNYSYDKLVEIISILREFDLKSKGYDASSVDDADLMKEMVFRILH